MGVTLRHIYTMLSSLALADQPKLRPWLHLFAKCCLKPVHGHDGWWFDAPFSVALILSTSLRPAKDEVDIPVGAKKIHSYHPTCLLRIIHEP